MKKRLGARQGLIAISAIVALIVAGLAISPAFGGPGFLTKKKASKLYAKKKSVYTKAAADARYLTPSQADSRYLTQSQADGRYLTQGQADSRYLTQSQADGRYLPADGPIRINASPMTWQKISAAPGIDTLPQRPEIGATGFGGSSMALSNVPVAIQPTLPTELVGRPLTFVGVNACYATDAITTLSTVWIHLTTNTNGSGNTEDLLIDTTDRNDDNCRDYTLPTPHTMAPGEDISLQYSVDYSANAGFFSAGRATFIFQP